MLEMQKAYTSESKYPGYTVQLSRLRQAISVTTSVCARAGSGGGGGGGGGVASSTSTLSVAISRVSSSSALLTSASVGDVAS
jgi:hypothetical protein